MRSDQVTEDYQGAKNLTINGGKEDLTFLTTVISLSIQVNRFIKYISVYLRLIKMLKKLCAS